MKRYRIISELGKGATGVVYRAVRSQDGSTVALKKLVLPGHLDAREEEEFIKRFKSEAKAALELKHPGIVGALDCGMDEGTFYIAYELIEGVTLEEAIKSGRRFSPEEVADIIIQAAEALEVAHAEGVVHRDLSPGNIFITNEGKARISDFGVAGFTSRTTITTGNESIVGTPGYMAPEQITGGEANPRSDIFSLGCVAYELLAGEPAFAGENIAQIIHRVINEQPRPIRDLNPRVPLALEEIVFRMLAKNPDYRYQSMGEVHSTALRVLEEIPRATKKEAAQEVGHAPMLVAVGGPHEGETFNLQPTVTTIGRVVGDILLTKDGRVASQHSWITKEETGWVLYDADSENGTLLNGEAIEREEILPGDTIQIGDTVLEFRGAGGHVGVFQDADEAAKVAAAKESAKAVAIPRRIPWALIILLAIPGVAVLIGLIMIGIVLPLRYVSALDHATNPRWDAAFDRLDAGVIGTPEWLEDAQNVLADWSRSPVTGDQESETGLSTAPADFMAPQWIIGSGKINNRVLYRFELFQLTEEFLVAVTSGDQSQSDDGSDISEIATSAYQAVGEIEPRIAQLEVPEGADAEWQGRKHQLLAVVRRWQAASMGGTTTAQSGGFQPEKIRAQDALLTGWYTYEAAGNNLGLLSTAFSQFEDCISALDPVLEISPGEEEASALRGLAYFLCAKIKRQAGDSLGPERYRQALMYLDSAESDLSSVGRDVWDRIIPRDFDDEFPSPGSVQAQIRALRLTLQNLLMRPPPAG